MTQARVERRHRAEMRLLIGALLVVTAALVPYEALLLRADPTPLRALIQLHLVALVVAGVSAGATLVTRTHRHLLAAVVVGTAAGAATGFVLSLATGTGFGEELDGLVFRVIGAAVLGLVAGLAVRVLAYRDPNLKSR